MQIYTRRNAVIGWIVTRRARRRLERRLNAIAGHRPHGRRRLAVGAGLAAGLAVTAGALVVMRRSTGQAQTA